MTAQTSAVRKMFSAYLNQDFDIVFGSADDALFEFKNRSDPGEIPEVMDEIQSILRMNLAEEDLQRLILQDLGCFYYYPVEWPNGRLWLEHVMVVLGTL